MLDFLFSKINTSHNKLLVSKLSYYVSICLLSFNSICRSKTLDSIIYICAYYLNDYIFIVLEIFSSM